MIPSFVSSAASVGVLVVMLAGRAQATPVTVSQSVAFPEIAAFGTFTSAQTTPAGWSSLWPFTSAVQIRSVTLSFSSTDQHYGDPALFPTGFGGGVPGVELGFIVEGTNSRLAIASVNASAPTIAVTDTDAALYDALVATLLDGAATFSLGGFVNYPNANPAFSEGAIFNGGTLTVRVDGDLAEATVPEPNSLVMVALALAVGLGAGHIGRRHRRSA